MTPPSGPIPETGMNSLDALLSAGSLALQVVLVLAIPWAVAKIGRLALERFGPSGFFEVPVVTGIARSLGVLVGLLLLSGHAAAFDLRTLFGPDSPWNLTIWQFLAASANPLWTLDGLAGQVTDHGIGVLYGALAVLIGILLLAALATTFAFWRGAAPWRAALSAVCLAIVTAYVTIYGISLLFWLLFLLNFWMLALLLVALQWYRNRA